MKTLNVRIEDQTKKAAHRIFTDLGMDMSTGIKLFLNQVIFEKGLPFTPTKNPAAIRARWDAEVRNALSSGVVYKTSHDALRGL